MICKSCSAEIADDAKFCENCGTVQIDTRTEDVNGFNYANYANYRREVDGCEVDMYDGDMHEVRVKKVSNKNKVHTVLLSAILVLVLVLIIIMVYAFFGREKSENDSGNGNGAAQSVETSEGRDDTYTEPFDRFVTYSPDYTYKDMQEIHYSMVADDEEAYKMEDVINNFNSLWVDYVNTGNSSVFGYLRQGTKAYEYAINFGSKYDLTESYELIDVNDVRVYRNNYYVWVHEIINKNTSEGSQRAVYHWVYKIGKDSDGYYVENYRSDPYYK